MNDTLTKNLHRIAWGWILLHMSFHLGNIDLLPDWLGYILVLNGLLGITPIVPQASGLFSFGIGLGCVSLLQWLLALVGIDFSPMWLTLIVAVVSLYFQYQLLYDLATLADVNELSMGTDLRKLSSANLLCCTILYFLAFLGLDLVHVFDTYSSFTLLFLSVLLIGGLIVTVRIAKKLFDMKRELSEKEEIRPLSRATYKQDEE